MAFIKNKTNILLLVATISILSVGIRPDHWHKGKAIKNDMAEYYAYLPATFIYNDLTFSFRDSLPSEYKKRVLVRQINDQDKWIVKMPMGVSVLHMPFFIVAHTVASITNYASDGFSFPYQAALFLSNLTYLILGLFILKKTLRKYYSENTTFWTILIMVFGTNLYYYSTYHPGMSHIYSFFAMTLFVDRTIKWHSNPTIKESILVGIITGLITILRPTNILFVLIFILYDVHSFQSAKKKISVFFNHYRQIIIIIAASIVVLSPQLVYWKIITGNWYYYSYDKESFFFNDPEIINGLFSFRKGWLLYTPLMTFSLLGMMFLKKLKTYLISIPITIAITLYIMFSWWVWWYAGSFSCRPIIEFYSILSIPLGLFIQYFLKQRIAIKSIFITLVFLLISLNIWQSYQYKKGVLHYDGMTRESYGRLFFAKKYTKNYKALIDRPDYELQLKNIEKSESDYESQLSGKDLKLFRNSSTDYSLRKVLKSSDLLAGKSLYEKLLAGIKEKEKYPEIYSIVVNYAKKRIEKKVRNFDKRMQSLKEKASSDGISMDAQVEKHVNYLFERDYITSNKK